MRTQLITGLAVVAMTAAVPLAVLAETKAVPADKIFPFLKAYLALPAQNRDHFHLTYSLMTPGLKPADVHLVLKRGSGDVELANGNESGLLPQPTLDDLAHNVQIAITAPKDAKLGINMRIDATLPLATHYAAGDLNRAISQAHDGAKSAAGLLAVAVPDLQGVCFAGVTSGTATLGNGRTVALKPSTKPGQAGTPCYTPSEQSGVTTITLDGTPKAVYIIAK